MPVYDNVAFEFDSAEDISLAFAGKKPAHSYSRITNPTVENLEVKIKNITGATGVVAVASGMAAISNLIIALAQSGDNIVTTKNLFGNTYSLFEKTLKSWGLSVKYVDLKDIDSVANAIDEKTRVIYLETITNPQLEVVDIKKISALAKERNILVVADNTVTPLYFYDAKELGIDVEVLSSTKYISGGATTVGGIIIDYGTYKWKDNPKLVDDAKKFGPFALVSKLKKEVYRNLGAAMAPHNAYLQSLGLETMALRVEKSCFNTAELAKFLDSHEKVVSVNYPGLSTFRDYEVATSQFDGVYGALLTFDLKDKETCFKVINRLELIRRSTNLNDNKTLIIHPASTIFVEYDDATRAEMGVRDTMIRLAVGIEDVEDLIADLEQALE